MLTETEREAALEIVLDAKDPEDFPIINDLLCRVFPSIQTDDLIALWREVAERQATVEEMEAALDTWAECGGGWGREQ